MTQLLRRIGLELKRLRQSRGDSLKKLAARAGLNPAEVHALELGRGDGRAVALAVLAETLDVPLGRLARRSKRRRS